MLFAEEKRKEEVGARISKYITTNLETKRTMTLD